MYNESKVSDRAVNWISSYLNSYKVRNLVTTRDGFSSSSQIELRSHGLRSLNANHLKRISSDVSKIGEFDLPHVRQEENKAKHLQTCILAFQKIELNPTLWVHLDKLLLRANRVPKAAQVSTQASSLPAVTVATPINHVPQQTLNSPTVPSVSSFHPVGPVTVATKALPAMEQRPATSSSSPVDSLEYVDGIICINLVKYPEEIPKPLMDALKRKSEYLGHPSKLRYEQVKIKREKQEKSNSTSVLQQDVPKTPIEMSTVSLLRQMGFQNIQEIMSSMRNVQRLSPQITNPHDLADAIMMDIVTAREEDDEAKKMDAARVLSEETSTVRVRVERDDSESDVLIMYDTKEMLGIGTAKSVAYPDSELLKSSRVRNLFYSIFTSSHDGQKMITKLLNLEQKCCKWYGRNIPVAFFRYVLVKKIQLWVHQQGNQSSKGLVTTSSMRSKLQSEISRMESEMYDLSKQVDGVLGLKVPKIFMDAYRSAISQGLIEDDSKNNIIVLD